MTGGDRFCEMCGVDLGLHGTADPDPNGADCAIAERKADLLARWFGEVPS